MTKPHERKGAVGKKRYLDLKLGQAPLLAERELGGGLRNSIENKRPVEDTLPDIGGYKEPNAQEILQAIQNFQENKDTVGVNGEKPAVPLITFKEIATLAVAVIRGDIREGEPKQENNNKMSAPQKNQEIYMPTPVINVQILNHDF